MGIRIVAKALRVHMARTDTRPLLIIEIRLGSISPYSSPARILETALRGHFQHEGTTQTVKYIDFDLSGNNVATSKHLKRMQAHIKSLRK